MALLFECVIPGRPVPKKNSKKFIRKHGFTMVVYSKVFKAWEEIALFHMKQAKKSKTIDVPLEERLVFRFKNHKWEADTSNLVESPNDVLKLAGVISDDKIIQVIHAKKEFCDVEETVVQLFSIGDA